MAGMRSLFIGLLMWSGLVSNAQASFPLEDTICAIEQAWLSDYRDRNGFMPPSVVLQPAASTGPNADVYRLPVTPISFVEVYPPEQAFLFYQLVFAQVNELEGRHGNTHPIGTWSAEHRTIEERLRRELDLAPLEERHVSLASWSRPSKSLSDIHCSIDALGGSQNVTRATSHADTLVLDSQSISDANGRAAALVYEPTGSTPFLEYEAYQFLDVTISPDRNEAVLAVDISLRGQTLYLMHQGPDGVWTVRAEHEMSYY